MNRLLLRFDKNRNGHKEGTPLLTPTAINRYMRCPKQFYYNYVCGLREPETDDSDEIDNRIFGNIFHEASQKIYERITAGGTHITADNIKWMLSHGAEIERIVDETFMDELFKLPKGAGTRPEYNGLQLINRRLPVL